MADRQDWIEWDNSMKAHIDQINVTWKNDQLLMWKDQQAINKAGADFDHAVIGAVEELYQEQQTSRRMIAICGILLCLDLIVGFIAIMEGIRA